MQKSDDVGDDTTATWSSVFAQSERLGTSEQSMTCSIDFNDDDMNTSSENECLGEYSRPSRKRARVQRRDMCKFGIVPLSEKEALRRYDRANMPALPPSIHGDSEEMWLHLHAKVRRLLFRRVCRDDSLVILQEFEYRVGAITEYTTWQAQVSDNVRATVVEWMSEVRGVLDWRM